MNIDLSIKNGLLVNICYLSIAEVFKVGVVKVDESVLELSDNHGTILKRIFSKLDMEIAPKDNIFLF